MTIFTQKRQIKIKILDKALNAGRFNILPNTA